MENPNKIEIEGLKTIHKLCNFGAEHDMEGCSFTEIVERMFSKIEKMKAQVDTLDEMLLNQGKALAKAQAVPEGFVLVPKEPTEEMWGGLSRVLGRYMQSKERYCPKTLKRYLDMFAKDIPDWLNKEVTNWNSDHAFATADLPVFIYKAMIEAQEQSNESN